MPTPARARRSTPEQRDAAAAARSDRLAALHRQLADGVAAIRDGQAWTDWLRIAARFHTYSFRNQILIAAQRPDATMVAGYQAWAAMGRQVLKGEKALWVLAPVTRRRTSAADDDASAAANASRGGDGAPEPAEDGATGPGNRQVVGFRGVAVFDISQTDGPDLPTPPRPQLLAGQAPPGLWGTLEAAITARGFTVTRCPDAAAIGGANGLTDFTRRAVTVRADVDDAQAVKTLAHEAGHVWLHNPTDPGQGAPCRDLIEVEAESVAYLVAAHHGLDTADYTFAYIAGWAGRDDDAVTTTAGRVLAAARELITATDEQAAAAEVVPEALQARAVTGVNAAEGTAADAEAGLARVLAVAGHAHRAELRLREVTGATQAWFSQQALTAPTFAAATAARGHTSADAHALGVGWAPHGWTGLVDHLRSRGFTPDEMQAAGVATTTTRGRLIDRFRGRITFPIHDDQGVVGFTGRDVTGREGTPKYLNTPTTTLYDKSRLLFGTQHLTDETQTVVLVEGPWDALAVTASGGGLTGGLAACGTAVTEHHLELATRAGRSLILAPDPDAAGLGSLGRTLALITTSGGPHPGAIMTPPESDLADSLTSGGTAAVESLLGQARAAGIVYAEQYLRIHPPGDSPEARVAAARRAAEHAPGMITPHLAELGAVLMRSAGIGPEGVLAILRPAGEMRLTASASGDLVGARNPNPRVPLGLRR